MGWEGREGGTKQGQESERGRGLFCVLGREGEREEEEEEWAI